MSKEKQIDIIIDLLTDFDEMGFVPTTAVPDPDAYAIEWKNKLTSALQGYRKQEWISVEDRLPESDARVLVYMHENRMSYTKIDTDRMVQRKWVRWGDCVTRWMPLPDAPKGDEKE